MKVVLFLAILFSLRAPAATDCELEGVPTFIAGAQVWRWDLADRGIFWQQDATSQDPSFLDFRVWTTLQPNLMPAEAKVRAEYEKLKQAQGEPRALQRLEAVLSGQLGSLGSISCLESALFAFANTQRAQKDAPYEFGADILVKESGGQRMLRIYLSLGDGTSVTKEAVEPLIAADLKEAGWSLFADLHNHPFSTENDYLSNGGYTAPSDGDMSIYQSWKKSYGLQNAWITNGVNTFRMPSSQFDGF